MNNNLEKTSVRHGGDLANAMALYGGATNEWLDLSTGISPWSYPIPAFDNHIWRELPAPHDDLMAAAASYYQCPPSEVTATPGSQLAIRLIPQLIDHKQTVAIPLIGYQEHASAWKMAGHTVLRYQNSDELFELTNSGAVNNAVVINPNNPTGELITSTLLKALSERLSGLLLIDEAFSDLDNSHSRSDMAIESNTVVLKSIGKFFGLAGARIGFTLGTHPVVEKLKQLLSPWSIAAPSIALATLALNDTQWQTMQRTRIKEHAQKQRVIVSEVAHSLPNSYYCDQSLFFSIFAENQAITSLHTQLAEQKIWARLGDSFVDTNQCQLNWLRLSLAADQLDRLSRALQSANTNDYLT